MSQALKAQEPSMEEILASIRRIIADDEAKPAAPAVAKSEPPLRPVPAATPAAQDAASRAAPTTHDLMEALEPPRAAPAPMFRDEFRAAPELRSTPEVHAEPAKPAIDPLDALEAEIAATAMARPIDEPVVIEPEEEPEYQAPAAVQAREEPRWTEPVTETALVSPQTSDAVNSAFNALAHSVMAQNSERLDEMSRQMLRPMLKAWLDDNLPSIVERLVRAEIERVARGR